MRISRWMTAGLLLAGVCGTMQAQDDAAAPLGVIAGLSAPRHITLNANQEVVVAEAGTGGDTTATVAIGDGLVGNTGRVLVVASDATTSDLVTGLYSFASPMNEVLGVHKALVVGEDIWYLVGQGPVADNAPVIENTFALIRVNGSDTQVIDLYSHEVEENPDGGEIDSNPVDFEVAMDGSGIYIADAGANAVLKWNETDGVTTFAAWAPVDGEPQAVPTSVLSDADGNVYVSFLRGFPFPTGGSRVEEYDAAGTLINTIEGLTMVTDLFWGSDGESLYAVQFANSFGDRGWEPNSGSVVLVNGEEPEAIITGLQLPYGGLQLGDTFVVSVSTSFSPAQTGMLWAMLPGDYLAYSMSLMPDATEEAPAPETTEEAGG